MFVIRFSSKKKFMYNFFGYWLFSEFILSYFVDYFFLVKKWDVVKVCGSMFCLNIVYIVEYDFRSVKSLGMIEIDDMFFFFME